MRKANVPSTSIDAYRNLDPIKISETMQKIADALKAIGRGNYEDIAKEANMKEEKVWKRLIDTVRAGLIHRTDEKKLTKNNAASYIYAPGPATQIIKKRERVMKGKTVAQYSRDILSINENRLF